MKTLCPLPFTTFCPSCKNKPEPEPERVTWREKGMTHNEARGTVTQEALIGLFTGALYGGAHTLTGHPLDTIKSKMQIQAGYSNQGAFAVAAKIFRTEGYLG